MAHYQRHIGFDHCVGDFGPLIMTSESSNVPSLRYSGAFASYIGSWCGRRHDRGRTV